MGKRILAWLFALLLLGGAALAEGNVPSMDAAPSTDAAPAYAAYNGKRLGVLTGPLMEDVAREYFPDSEVLLFNSYPDCITALLVGKIDAYLGDELGVKSVLMERPDIDYIRERITENNYSFAFRKNDPLSAALREELNAFLAKCWADGTMDALDDIWFGEDEARKVVDMSGLTGENGTIKVVTTSTDPPFSYIKDGKNVGYDIDLIARFCRDRGYALELGDVDFAGRIPAIESGKYDFTTDMNVTPEREEQVLFSDPVCKGGIVLAVRKDEAPTATESAAAYTFLSQLNGARIGVQTGTVYDEIVLEALPDAQISYFNTYPDMAAAMEANKIDGFPGDEPVLRLMAAEDDQLAVMDDYMESFEFGFVIPKTPDGDALAGEANAWLLQMRECGELDALIAKWVDGPEREKIMPDYAAFPAEKGTLRFATEGAYAPMNYFRGNELVGFEVELAARFCEANGYGFSPEAMNFDGILPAVQSGKVDFGGACISITEERRESVNFSDPYYVCRTAMCVLKDKETPVIQTGGYTALSDLTGKRIGVQTGSSFDRMVFELIPDAKVSYFNSKADLVNALLSNKIDAYTMDEPVVRAQMHQDDRLTYIPEYMERFDFAYVFPKTDKGQSLCDQFNEYLQSIRSDGTMAQIEAKWFSEDDSQKTIADYRRFPAPNGTLHMVTEAMYEPFTYILNNKISGYEIDIAVHFCEAFGYGLEITDMNFDGILPSVQSGKCDFGGAGITITGERRESVLFSEPDYSGGTVMAVLKAKKTTAIAPTGETEDTSFWGGIKSSFHKTFIREGRWRLFVDGVLTTLLITALTILFGTLLGFVVFMLCRNGNPVANAVTRVCLWLVQGMPMVVLLMILYYVIFGSVAISGVFVAVIGFTLTFGAAVFGLLKMGVGAVDGGQYEAAYALGHSNRRTFFSIILPQALPHVLPAYRGEIVGLIKATAIVGYIAVQDLTKMGDIVRSRTYEAFFPLIAVTVIYFVLEGLIGFLVSRVSVNFNPKRRKPADILKGVKTDDQN